ncbi:hypothetical protein AURDEDRAFT_31499, partial [Auricularia subglabra TFB-10046 SS5]
NRTLTNSDSTETAVIVPGRVITVRFEWHRGDFLTIMAVYAPTNPSENKAMWSKVISKLKEDTYKLPFPDILLGDFNFVEDEIDRLPASLNDIDSPDSFDELKRYLHVTDGWREAFPGAVEWTWRNAARSSMSRIDRIYTTATVNRVSRNWAIEISGITRNDHSRVQSEIANLEAPEIGPGRWTMRDHLVKDETFMTGVMKLALEAQSKMRSMTAMPRRAEDNVQTVWKKFKDDVATAACRRMRSLACK